TSSQRTTLIGAMALGGIIGALGPYVVDGSVRFSGVGLPSGIVVGLLAYLSARMIGRPRERKQPIRPDGLLLAGLLAAVVAHFVEIQVGIATVSTRLYFAAFAGLVVAIGVGLTDDEARATR